MPEAPHSECPRCGNPFPEWIPLMRRYFPHENWFRCETCDHLFTIRVPAETPGGEEEHLRFDRSLGQRFAWDD